ncbi:MAG: helix-turn-helix domain-containing protein [Polyangiales bacterium]|nr:hypothetical protein [Sandaracinaceae bacterium]
MQAPLLRHRLANAPSVFLGRDAEEDALRVRLRRGPVSVVCGAAGHGKSALVQAVLRDAPQVRVVRCQVGQALSAVGAELMHAFGAETTGAEDTASAAWPSLVLDAAEQGSHVVVLEDLHLLERSSAARWLDVLACYARTSRWIVTSRERPTLAAIQEQVVMLGPLDDAATRALTRACGAWLSELEVERIASASRGSPGAVREQVASARSGEAGASSALEARAPAGTLAPPPERPHGEEAATPAPARPTSEPLDELRALLREDARGAAAALLHDRQESWLRSGRANELWAALETEHDDRLRPAKMTVALELGSRDALEWLTEHAHAEGGDERLLWAKGLLQRGRSAQATEVLESDMDQASPNEARLLLGEALCSAGRPQQAIAVLRQVEPKSATERVARDLRLCRALFHAGQSTEAGLLLASADRVLRGIPREEAGVLLGERMGLSMQLGLKAEPTREAEASLLGRHGRVFAGIRLLAEGRAGRARHLLRTLDKESELPAGVRLLSAVGTGLLRVTGGHYVGLATGTREVLREAEQLGNATLYQWAFMLERLVSLGASMDSPEPTWSSHVPLPVGVFARYLLALRVAHRARRGELVRDEQLPRAQPGDGPLVTCVCELLQVHVCLLRGEAARAERLAAQLAQKSADLRFLFFEGEVLLMLCYAQLALGRHDLLSTSVEALARVARRTRSRRYMVIAELLRAALGPAPNVHKLTKLASLRDASPTAARVASTLLGASASADSLDQLLVRGISARWHADIQPLTAGRRALWVFDPETGLLFLTDRCEQASPLLARILSCLFDAAASPLGYATLEDLARTVWDVSDYHALRDAKRVHVAIRRLRTLIEDDASAPTRLLTVDGGYTLARAERPARVVTRRLPAERDAHVH